MADESKKPALEALMTLQKGDWKGAHEIVQKHENPHTSLVHAHLHRVEGDLSNARYWYQRAGEIEHKGPTDEEWRELVARFSSASKK